EEKLPLSYGWPVVRRAGVFLAVADGRIGGGKPVAIDEFPLRIAFAVGEIAIELGAAEAAALQRDAARETVDASDAAFARAHQSSLARSGPRVARRFAQMAFDGGIARIAQQLGKLLRILLGATGRGVVVAADRRHVLLADVKQLPLLQALLLHLQHRRGTAQR